MKKLLLCFLIIPVIGFSQEEKSSKKDSKNKDLGNARWEVGLNGGVNFTNLVGSEGFKIDNRFGQLYGITLIYHASRFASIKTDFDYENKGWVFKGYDVNTQSGTSQQDVSQHLDYFDIPLFLHLGFGKRLKIDFNFGTYVGILMRDNAFYINSNGQEVSVQDALTGGFKNMDWGLTYGGGIDYVLSKKFSFGFDLLIEQGLAIINEQKDWKNRSLDFDFGINYMFGQKGKKKKE